MATAEWQEITPKVEAVVSVVLILTKEESQGLRDLLYGGISASALSKLSLTAVSDVLKNIGIQAKTPYQLRWDQIAIIGNDDKYKF